MIEYHKHTLKNGLRVLTAPMHDTKATAVLIMVGAGSRYEGDDIAGMSHFLEHMFFKGTKKRPSYLDVSKELDSLGAHFNAFTGQEYTGYYVHAAADQFPKSLDILADMLLNGTLPEREIVKEKGVITEELNMYWDMPQSAVAQTIDKLLFDSNPLGRPIVGTKQTISATTRAKLLDYKKRYYKPSNMVIAIAGNPANQNWLQLAERYFGSLEDKKTPTYKPFLSHQIKPNFELIKRKTDQAHFVVAWHGIKRTDPSRPTLKVLNNLMGGMMSSRLFDEIREKRGLAYYVGSGYDDFHDTGSFYARAGVTIDKINDALAATIATIEQLKVSPVSIHELKRAKENLKGQLYLGLENSFAVAEFLADQELLWGYIEQPENIVKAVEKVTAHEITALAKEILRPERLNVAVIGPYKTDTEFKKIIGA